MELVAERPTGAAINIWRCRSCGDTRACRPGWRTRCHICLDRRTVLDEDLRGCIEAELAADAELAATARRNVNQLHGHTPARVSALDVIQTIALAAVADLEERLERPGWTVLAVDIFGLPWHYWPDAGRSHGSWAEHDACGTVRNITASRPECPTCPPEPHSRTHRAKASDPQLLYLVRFGDLLKFGHGDAQRVRTHLRQGCQPVLVLRGRHEAVVAAERQLKARHHGDVIDPRGRHLPPSFGIGTEVVEHIVAVDLRAALPGTEVRDVTNQFAEYRQRP
jgi:hypothetical protein